MLPVPSRCPRADRLSGRRSTSNLKLLRLWELGFSLLEAYKKGEWHTITRLRIDRRTEVHAGRLPVPAGSKLGLGPPERSSLRNEGRRHDQANCSEGPSSHLQLAWSLPVFKLHGRLSRIMFRLGVGGPSGWIRVGVALARAS